jgi:hypothetical protein
MGLPDEQPERGLIGRIAAPHISRDLVIPYECPIYARGVHKAWNPLGRIAGQLTAPRLSGVGRWAPTMFKIEEVAQIAEGNIA